MSSNLLCLWGDIPAEYNNTGFVVNGDSDRSKQLPTLLSVECSVYLTLAWRSSGENVSLFRALPLYSFYDAPSPLTDVRSHCQFSCGPMFCQPSLSPPGVLSLHPYPVTRFFNSPLGRFFFGQSPATLIHFVMLVAMNPLQPTSTGKCVAFHPASSHSPTRASYTQVCVFKAQDSGK